MRFAGAAGSRPLAALPQFGSVPGRLAGGKSGRGDPGAGQDGGDAPRRAEGTKAGRDRNSAQRDTQKIPEVRSFNTGVPVLGWALAGAAACPSVFQISPQPVWLRQSFHGKKESVSQSRTPFPGAELLPSVDLTGAVRGRGCCVQDLSAMQPHISLFPGSQICLKSCDETELQNPLYEHPN